MVTDRHGEEDNNSAAGYGVADAQASGQQTAQPGYAAGAQGAGEEAAGAETAGEGAAGAEPRTLGDTEPGPEATIPPPVLPADGGAGLPADGGAGHAGSQPFYKRPSTYVVAALGLAAAAGITLGILGLSRPRYDDSALRAEIAANRTNTSIVRSTLETSAQQQNARADGLERRVTAAEGSAAAAQGRADEAYTAATGAATLAAELQAIIGASYADELAIQMDGNSYKVAADDFRQIVINPESRRQLADILATAREYIGPDGTLQEFTVTADAWYQRLQELFDRAANNDEAAGVQLDTGNQRVAITLDQTHPQTGKPLVITAALERDAMRTLVGIVNSGPGLVYQRRE